MCFIVTSIKLKEDKVAQNAIFNVLAGEQADNAHGTASLCYSKDGKPVIWRGDYEPFAKMQDNLHKFEVVNYHFRQATVGKKTLENVHFWQVADWAFCHNGVIANLGDEEESDSLKFFNYLVAHKFLPKQGAPKLDEIKAYVNESSLMGRFLLINLKTKDIYFFGDFQVYLVAKSHLVITSANADFKRSYPVMGFSFELEGDVEALEADMDGINLFSYKDKQFRTLFEKLKEYKPHPNAHKSTTTTTAASPKPAKPAPKDDEDFTAGQVAKTRTNESYIQEFKGRLKAQHLKDPYLEEAIRQELINSEVNEFGRTLTEDDLWELWIVPQMESNGEYREIYLRDENEVMDMMEFHDFNASFKKQ